MRLSTETPVMAIVVDRLTRKIMDVHRVVATYNLGEVFERHDLNKVEIIFRAPENTWIEQAEEPEVEVTVPPAPQPAAVAEYEDDDVPF